MDQHEISAKRKILEYPRPDALNGEALEEQLCAALSLDEALVDVGLSGDTLQVGVPKGIRKSVVDAVVRRHDGARASDSWLKRRGMA